LGIKWFCEVFCPASAFVSAEGDEARDARKARYAQRFIHVTAVFIKEPSGFKIK
jgi:hypothetical protein